MDEAATEWATDLAARLALACGERLIVRFGCLLAGGGGASQWRIELYEPPVQPILVVLPYDVEGSAIEECARAGVPQVWLCRVEQQEIEIVSEPIAGRFRRRSLILAGETVELPGMPGIVLAPLASDNRG